MMVCKYACGYFRILKLFFVTFLHFELKLFSRPNTTEVCKEYAPCPRNSPYSFENLQVLK